MLWVNIEDFDVKHVIRKKEDSGSRKTKICCPAIAPHRVATREVDGGLAFTPLCSVGVGPPIYLQSLLHGSWRGWGLLANCGCWRNLRSVHVVVVVFQVSASRVR